MKRKVDTSLPDVNETLPIEMEDSFKALEHSLKKNFPGGIPRKDLAWGTGYLLHPRSAANLDCLGEGIPGRFKIGRNTIYPVCNVIAFLKSKAEAVAQKKIVCNDDCKKVREAGGICQ